MKKKRNQPDNPKLEKIWEYFYVLAGSAIIAIAFNVFLLPNRVASGGVSGISTLLHALLGWEPAYVQWAFNIPLFIAGLILLGKQFGSKTLVGTVFLPFVVFLTNDWNAWTHEPLLGSIFGGLVSGLASELFFAEELRRVEPIWRRKSLINIPVCH